MARRSQESSHGDGASEAVAEESLSSPSSSTSSSAPLARTRHATGSSSSSASSSSSSTSSSSGHSSSLGLSGLDDGLSQLASSWSNSLEGELQRDLLSAQLFDSAPVAIDRFVVERRLGAGASSIVFACRDPLLERRVAIKVLARPSDGLLAKVNDQVIREARALAKIPHRNIVAIYEIGTWQDRSFIAMELIEGMTLASWLAAAARTVPQILDAFLQAGRGLATAHAHGMVHRDFKPANVLVAQDGRVVVSDFGLVGESLPPVTAGAGGGGDAASRLALGSSAMNQAKAERPAEGEGEAGGSRSEGGAGRLPRPVGTPAYAAPEQRAGVVAHPSADVYSFALSLIEALLGYHPMPALPLTASPKERDAAISAATTAWKAALRPRIPRRLYLQLCAAAERDPALRTASLSPLLEALGPDVAASPRRRWWPAAVVAALFVLLGVLVTLGLAWSFLDRRELAQLGSQLVLGERERERRVRGRFIEAPAPRPGALGDNLLALLHTPPFERDERWRRAARILSLLPVPTEVPCRWPSPPRTQAILGEHVVTLDRQGAVTACHLATAELQPLAQGISCIQPDERGALIVAPARGDVELHRYAAGSWDRAAPPPSFSRRAPLAPPPDVDGYCNFAASPAASRSSFHASQRSPAGHHTLVLREGGALQVLDVVSGRRYPLAEAQVRRAQFLDEDRVVATDEAGRVWRWSLSAQRSFVISDHLGTGALWGLAISPDSTTIASSAGGSPTDSAVRLASVRGEPLRELRVAPGAGIHALAFSGDRLLAGSNDGVLHIWKWPTLEKLAERPLPKKAWVWSVAVARPGGGDPVEVIGMGRLTVPGQPMGGSPVLLARGDQLRTVFTAAPQGNTGTDDLAVSADGRLVAASFSSGELALIDVATGKVRAVKAHLGESRRVRFSDSFSRVVTIGDDGNLRSWSLSGEPLAELYIGHGQLYELEISGTSALVGASDGHLGLWDLPSQRLVHTYAGHSVGVSVARFDGTAQWLASADLSGRICLRPRDDEECHTELLGHLPGKAIRNARFLPDGRLATSSDDTTVRLWSPPYDLTDDQLACRLAHHLFTGPPAECAAVR